ncbi:hypothetical protein U9M48_043506 [Paspalum notatum var. saurae]|uniref:Uncharacterized protein n=1 Tax=Paspalum notatum var. saurae TaxID=547442 RepID=A0AAQ3UT91_PASNO
MTPVDPRKDQDHYAAAAVNFELEVQLVVGERGNGAASTPTAGPRPPTDGGRTRRLARRLHPATLAHACWRCAPRLGLVGALRGGVQHNVGLLLLGSLDRAFPRRPLRNQWVEINNQVLNALFTLMSIYQHPALFHHAVLLLWWCPDDAKALREAYCRKGPGAARP